MHQAGGYMQKFSYSLLVICVLFAHLPLYGSEDFPSAIPASVGLSDSGLERINNITQALIDTEKVPGTVTMVARYGKLIYSESQGYADVEKKTSLSPHSIFRLMSMSKPVTSAAIVILHDDGLIDLDDPIKKYLPEFSVMNIYTANGLVPAAGDITIRQLLTHTSGLTYASLPGDVAEIYQQENVFAITNRNFESTEAHVKRLAKLPLVAHPGSEWNYGESLGVLGRLVEVVSAQRLGEFLKQRLFNPLGMVDTAFYVAPKKEPRLTQLYEINSSRKISLADPNNYGGSYLQPPLLEYGGAGLVGSPSDYMRFAQMLLSDGRWNGKQVISASGVEMLMSNQLPPAIQLKSGGILPPWPGVKFGFGFGGSVIIAKDTEEATGSVGEYCWGGWANTFFWVDPEQELVGLAFTQVISVSPDGPDLQVEFSAAVRSAIYEAIEH
jgi:CubicO group peptidase (beta-lactamase class C family)